MFKLLLLLIPIKTYAVIGSEIPLLVELVSQTTSQLNELERIVSNGERLTKKMTEYNEILEDHYFRAERLKILSEEIAMKRKAQNLGEFNFHLRSLKEAMLDSKKALSHYQLLAREEAKREEQLNLSKALYKRKLTLARLQQAKSEGKGSTKTSNRLTSQNTGLLLESSLNQERNLEELSFQMAKNNRLLGESNLKDSLKLDSKQSFYKGYVTQEKNSARKPSFN